MPGDLPSSLGPWCVGVRVVVRRVLPGQVGPTGGPAMTDVLGVLEEWGDSTLTVRPEDGPPVVVDRATVVSGKPVPPRPSIRLRVAVPELERRVVDSWPPLEREDLGDWVLRASAGFSARANSALVVGAPDRPWADALAAVEAFYAARGLPSWVQAMTGSEELARLEADGWTTARPGESDTGLMLAGVARARRAVAGLLAGSAATAPVRLADRVDEAWLADDARARAHHDAAVGVLEGPEAVTFAAVTAQDAVVAKGRAALSERAEVWVGLTDVWVDPDHRRRGLGLVVVGALLAWAAERGAATAYLQVRQDNPGAIALYEQVGFRLHHTYRYLQPPPH